MWKLTQTIGIVGFLICLSIMYLTDLGARGIRKFDASFKPPDMKFHYSVEQMTKVLEQIGYGGRTIYQRYLILDCFFTLFFLIVMLTITTSLVTGKVAVLFMIAVSLFRAVFDLLENLLLLRVFSYYPAVNTLIIKLCSWFTTIKFLWLYVWIAALIVQIV